VNNSQVLRVLSILLIVMCPVLHGATKKKKTAAGSTAHPGPVKAKASRARTSGTSPKSASGPHQTHAPARVSTAQLAPLAEGIEHFEQKDYPAAIPSLARARTQVPELGDYGTYYLAAAQDAQGDQAAALDTLGDLAVFRDLRSPLLAKAVVIAAQERLKSGAGNPAALKTTRRCRSPKAITRSP
jgi:hypothetical protein